MIKRALLRIIIFYQRYLSPFMGRHCRFYPSCSHYATEALNKYYWPRALGKTILRLVRCGPWSRGGVDLP